MHRVLQVVSNSCLYLLPAWCLAAVPTEISFTVKQFSVEGNVPVSSGALADYLRPLQQRQYNLQQLQDVAKGLEQIIRDHGYAFYRVSLPPQTLNGGEVKFRAVSFALDAVEVTGNHYFSKENIVASLPLLKAGQSPNTEELSEYLKVANKHPSKQLTLTFKQSAMEDKIDANISVNEQRPYQATAILNTLGSKGTGGFRLTGVLQHSNLWGLDHVINGSYTTSPDHADQVQQYGGSYSIPLYPLKSWLNAYYAKSDTNNGTVANFFNITGSGEMYGVHYQQLLPKLGKYEHWLDVGLDNRYFVSNVQFLNIPIGNNVRSLPLNILYRAEFPWQNAHFGYSLQWLRNTGIGDHNDQSYYTSSRLNATQDWDSLRYGANMSFSLQQWLLQTTFIGQYSPDSLIAGEQLGIGGSYDVRGYQERETSADKGEIVKFEVTSPPYQQISLFAFYDYGHGYHNNALRGEFKDWGLNSTGVGANWQWEKNVLAKITFAEALDNAQTTRAGDSRILANIVVRY